jgi:hypothetical protein
VRRAIEQAGATLWYLPPDSPDLNPIERCFATLKTIGRAARCRTIESLWPLLGECLQRFSPDECRNSFRHAGYSGATRSRTCRAARPAARAPSAPIYRPIDGIKLEFDSALTGEKTITGVQWYNSGLRNLFSNGPTGAKIETSISGG